MHLLSKIQQGATTGNQKKRLKAMAEKFYEFVGVYDNLDTDGKPFPYPYRIHCRTDNITNDLIYELEMNGYECKKGTTCNEWETSMQVRGRSSIKEHPPHMPVKIDAPPELEIMAPQWDTFLKGVKFLGHMLGTLNNGLFVPKQAFGHCDTSIVLEVYKRAYGKNYKSHQCNTCINHELDFKGRIVNHDVDGFVGGLKSFVDHYKMVHKEEFNRLKNTPMDYITERGELNRQYEREHPEGFLD